MQSADIEMTGEEVADLLISGRNWGRWGEKDQYGAVNLIDETKRLDAAKSVQHGVTVSLARPFPKEASPNNPRPALHHMQQGSAKHTSGGSGGSIRDFIGMSTHGARNTHLDALGHIWDEDSGMWGGRDPAEEIHLDGIRWGGIEVWREGIVTRGVLLDVARRRPEGYVTQENPVTGDELFEVAADQGIQVTAGDAVVIHSGREAWERDPADPIYSANVERPGLHASCLAPLRAWDCSVLVWDMMDAKPTNYNLPWTVHGAIISYGLALVDNARLDTLATKCELYGSYEFMLVIAPLWIEGATSSPVNPIAVL